MTQTSTKASRLHARRFLWLVLLVVVHACGGDAAAPADGPGIDDEAFISAYVDLRTTTIRSEGVDVSDSDRAAILARHGVTEDDLMAFVELHGEDVAYMRQIWDEVEARMDAVRVLPSNDERR